MRTVRSGADPAERVAAAKLSAGFLFLAVVLRGCIPETRAGSIFWKATDGAGRQLYVLGSLHLTPKEVYPLPEHITDAYRDADAVVFETDLDRVASGAFAVEMRQSARYPEGESLADHMPEETLGEFRRTAARYGLFPEDLLHYKPWYCANLLTITALRRLDFRSEKGIDRYFYDLAARDAKPVLTLETTDRQLQLLAGMSPEQSLQTLTQTIREIESLDVVAGQLMSSWLSGDADALGRLIRESFGNDRALLERWLLSRNRNWVPQLLEALERHRTLFVVVGAGHLVGPESVIDLLGKEGLRVNKP